MKIVSVRYFTFVFAEKFVPIKSALIRAQCGTVAWDLSLQCTAVPFPTVSCTGTVAREPTCKCLGEILILYGRVTECRMI